MISRLRFMPIFLATGLLLLMPLLGGCLGIGGGKSKSGYWWDDKNSTRMDENYRLPPPAPRATPTDLYGTKKKNNLLKTRNESSAGSTPGK